MIRQLWCRLLGGHHWGRDPDTRRRYGRCLFCGVVNTTRTKEHP